MNLARELERRLERLVDGLSATVFRGRMHPVDLANRLLRALDLNAFEGPAGPTIPNAITVGVNPSELDPDLDLAALAAELGTAVADLAADRGWRLSGPIAATVEADPAVAMGSIGFAGTHEPGELTPWAQLIDATGGRVLLLTNNRMVLGRAEDCDVVLPEAEVSRRHALVVRANGGVWVHDLASANGTAINGRRLGEHAAPLHAGDQLTLGPATFSFRVV